MKQRRAVSHRREVLDWQVEDKVEQGLKQTLRGTEGSEGVGGNRLDIL